MNRGRLYEDLDTLWGHIVDRRECDILDRYYKGRQSTKSIAEDYGVSGSRINQIRKSALQKIRRAIKEYGMIPYRMVELKRALNIAEKGREQWRRKYEDDPSLPSMFTVEPSWYRIPIIELKVNTRVWHVIYFLRGSALFELFDWIKLQDEVKTEWGWLHFSKLYKNFGKGSLLVLVTALNDLGVPRYVLRTFHNCPI